MTLPDQYLSSADAVSDFEFNFDGSFYDGDWVADNQDMYEKFGVIDVVEGLDKTKLLKFVEFRINFLQEELDEAKKAFAQLSDVHAKTEAEPAVGDALVAEYRDKLVVENGDDLVDAMIDLCVVAIGTLNALQVDAYEAWDRVHTANMTKQVGIKASRPNPLGLPDLIKPAGWVGPTHADNIGLLARFTTTGYVGDDLIDDAGSVV
jgi:predicted HAD superfamily Cof-like phosphohydrolase